MVVALLFFHEIAVRYTDTNCIQSNEYILVPEWDWLGDECLKHNFLEPAK